MPADTRRDAIVKLLRIALAAALAWGTVEMLTTLGRPQSDLPVDQAAMLARAAGHAPLDARKLAAAWGEQLGRREGALRDLRAALAAEPRLDARKAAAGRALAQLDSARQEDDLSEAARQRPEVRRRRYARQLRSLVKDTEVDVVAAGEALSRLALDRAIDRARLPGAPLVLDAFRREFTVWLAAGR